jgi:hypothetical protein
MDRRTAAGNDKIQFSLSALTLERRLKKKAEEERRRVEAEARIHVMVRLVWLGRLSADAK